MTEPKIIAFSGAHGTGKTTAVYEMACKMKKDQLGEVGVILETARVCPYPIFSKNSAAPTKEAQLWIFSAQMQAEMNATRKYGVVVSDRTIVDCIAYTAAARMYDLAYAMKEMAGQYAKAAYKEIYLRTITQNDYQIDDGSREMGDNLRKEIELSLLSLYGELGIRVNHSNPCEG